MRERRSGAGWKRSGSGWVLRVRWSARRMKLQVCYKGRLATLSEGLLSYIHQSIVPRCKSRKELDDAAGKCQGGVLAGFGISRCGFQFTTGGAGIARPELPR